MPTVSVIVPTYNCADFVGGALQSVLRQTYHDFELIVVDDGSQDHTAEVVKGFGQHVVYIRQQNAGVAAARNQGIRESKGKYFAFLDADDTWEPRKLEEQVRILEEDPETALVCTDFTLIMPDGNKITSFLGRCRHVRSGNAFNEVIQENFILTSSVLLRRSCLTEVGMFDETLKVCEDRDLWLRICQRWKIHVLDEILAVKNSRSDNLTANTVKALRPRITVFEKLLQSNRGLSEESRKLIYRQLSQNLFMLGYDYFDRYAFEEARRALRSAVRYRWPNPRALAYLLACYAPPSWIRMGRAAKQAVS